MILRRGFSPRTERLFLISAVLAFSMIILPNFLAAPASASWTVTYYNSPSSAYIGQVVDFSIQLSNSGENTIELSSAELRIDWGGSIVTERTLTGSMVITSGSHTLLTTTFTVPEVVPGTYPGVVTIQGTATGDWLSSIKTCDCDLSVSVAPLPEVSIQAYANSGQAPFTTTFVPTVTGAGPFQYSWSFGDGTMSEEITPHHTFSDVDTYTVTLVVVDSMNQQTSDSVTVTVTPPSVAGIPLYVIGIGIVALAAIGIVAFVILRKKKTT